MSALGQKADIRSLFDLLIGTPSKIQEFQRSKQSFSQLAQNEDWLAVNCEPCRITLMSGMPHLSTSTRIFPRHCAQLGAP